MGRLTLDWTQLIAFLGAVQGLFLAAVLLAQRSNRTANRLLATLTVTFTIYLAGWVYYSAGFVREYPHLFGISYLTPWVFGPLVYLYARAASDRSWRFTPSALVHFIPVAVVVALTLPVYALSGAEKLALWDRWSVQGIDPPLRTIDPLKYLSGIGYSIATVAYLRRHRRAVEDSYSNTARVSLAWLLRFSLATAAIWILAVGLRLSPLSTAIREGHITLAMALLIYGIGYIGLRQPEVFRHATAEFPILTRVAAAAVELPPPGEAPATPAPSAAPAPQYERSGLSDADARMLERSLRTLMERDEPWRDSDLTLSDLAARLDTTPHRLSAVLNGQVGESFYDFVNGYRVREVQRRIEAGDARTRTMLALAMDAGFASKSTFNEVFKKHTSRTPSDFRQAVGA